MATAVKYGVVYETVIQGLDLKSGQQVNNVMHYRPRAQAVPPAYGSAIPTTDLAYFANQIAIGMALDILPSLSANYRLSQIVAKEITGWVNPGTGPRLTYGDTALFVAAPTAVGAIAGDCMSAFDAMSCREYTSAATRNFRGSKRVGLVAESSQLNGKLTDAFYAANAAAIEGFFTTARATVLGGGPETEMQPVILSRKLAFAQAMPWVNTLAIALNITGATLHQNLGSQVSRKPRSDQLISN